MQNPYTNKKSSSLKPSNLKSVNLHKTEMFLDDKYFILVVDAEEYFDWDAEYSSTEYKLNYFFNIGNFFTLCKKYNIVPLLLLTYPLLKDKSIVSYLLKHYNLGNIELGIHQHPLVCPPFEEARNEKNSYYANLDDELIKKKMINLYNAFHEAFGFYPNNFKSGRYSTSNVIYKTIYDLNIKMDHSIAPSFSYLPYGNNYKFEDSYLKWLNKDLLSLPTSSGFYGWLSFLGPYLHYFGTSFLGKILRVNSIASFLHAYCRVRLSPENYKMHHLKKLINYFSKNNHKILSISVHSTSLLNVNKHIYENLEFIISELIFKKGYKPISSKSLYNKISCKNSDHNIDDNVISLVNKR